MHTRHRGLIAASIIVAGLAACSDRADQRAAGPTGPSALIVPPFLDGTKLRARGAGNIVFTTTAGSRTSLIPGWTATGTMTGGVAFQDPSTSPMGALAVAKPNRMLLSAGGGVRYSSTYDSLGNERVVAWIFAADGGPLRSVQTFVNGDLTMVTDYTWAAKNGGWALLASTRRTVVFGVQKAAVVSSANGVEVLAARNSSLEAIRRLGARAGRVFMPGELEAQFLGPCRNEWLDYIAATAALSAALSALERDPSNPVLIALATAAAARATIAEMKLWLCQQNALERGLAGGLAPGIHLPPLGCLVQTSSPTCDSGPPMIQ